MAHHFLPGSRSDQIEYRGIAQFVEQRSPKPRAEGSSPSAPAKQKPPQFLDFQGIAGVFLFSVKRKKYAKKHETTQENIKMSVKRSVDF